MKEKILWVVAIIAFVLGIWGLFLPIMPYIPSPATVTNSVIQEFGAIGGILAEQYIPYVRYNGGYKTELSLSVGSTTPKDIINIGGGTCTLTSFGTAGGIFAASTTLMHYCSATGVRVGDQVWVTLRSALPATASSSILSGVKSFGAIMVAGAVATTSDVIGVALVNWSGDATTSYANATTSASYLFFR